MTLKADLDRMRGLATVLHGLGQGVAHYTGAIPTISADTAALKAVSAAARITTGVINTTLIPTCAERLTETGEIMVNCADTFQNQDESAVFEVARVFTAATGTWGAGQ